MKIFACERFCRDNAMWDEMKTCCAKDSLVMQDVDGVECELSTDSQLLFRTKKINGQWFITNFESIYLHDTLCPIQLYR